MNVADESFLSYYAYDHSGERVLKMTGRNSVVDVNADVFLTAADIERITLYTSPYLVAGNTGYTKHYYAGTERVCARVGNGGLDRLGDFIGSDQDLSAMAKGLFNQCLESMSYRYLAPNESNEITTPCSTVCNKLSKELPETPYSFNVTTDIKTGLFEESMLIKASVGQDYEDIYFYHSDHLGSASWITDGLGTPVQHLQYLPFGEPFVDQRAAGSTYNERFTFTGKERDRETGFSYFGARYYDSDLTGLFLSVDPMADKYPENSPYHYCHWNPITQIDPNGSFDIKIHVAMVKEKANENGIKRLKTALLSYGTGIHSDIFLFAISNVHIDGKHNSNDIVSLYNKAFDGAVKDIKNGRYIRAGRELHTIADFYSHSNFLEVYADYAYENGIDVTLDNIPTLTEAQNDSKLWNYMQDKLETGDYSIINPKSTDGKSHNKMNKDNPDSEKGSESFGKTGLTFHEVAKKVATKAIDETM